MLATLTQRRRFDEGWIAERKLDGQRCLAFVRGQEVRLLSRNRKPATFTYPEVALSLARQGLREAVVDGEVVAFDGDRTSFARLQQRMGVDRASADAMARTPVVFYAFDLLHLDGNDARPLPLLDRKRLLEQALAFDHNVRFTAHVAAPGPDDLAAACARGWEGLLAKRTASPYSSGRSRDWLKLKCERGQELVVVGFTEPKGSRTGFGALLVAYVEGDRLHYAGRVGTGFDEATLAELRARLDALVTDEPQVDGPVPDVRTVTWVRPELVAEVAFTEWTTDGRLRHPRYKGLRHDKDPWSITRDEE